MHVERSCAAALVGTSKLSLGSTEKAKTSLGVKLYFIVDPPPLSFFLIAEMHFITRGQNSPSENACQDHSQRATKAIFGTESWQISKPCNETDRRHFYIERLPHKTRICATMGLTFSQPSDGVRAPRKIQFVPTKCLSLTWQARVVHRVGLIVCSRGAPPHSGFQSSVENLRTNGCQAVGITGSAIHRATLANRDGRREVCKPFFI